MISIPPYFLLIPFAIFFLSFVFFSLANIINLAKYGAQNTIGFLATLGFVAGTALILFFAQEALATVSWMTPVPVMEIQAPSF